MKFAKLFLLTRKKIGDVGEALVDITDKTGQYGFKVATHEIPSYCRDSYLYVKHRDHENDSDCPICRGDF